MSTKFAQSPAPILRTFDSFEELRRNADCSLAHVTLVNLDLRKVDLNWSQLGADATTLLLGCRLELEDEIELRRLGAQLLSAPYDLPYTPLRRRLYTWQELATPHEANRPETTDLRIYEHFSERRIRPDIRESLWQRLHDFSIDEALRNLLDFDEEGLSRRRSVGFMGGHGTRRDAPDFRRAAHTARLLGEAGYFVCSGGGPGIMEAANLGAYFANLPLADLERALDILAKAPHYTDPGFQEAAQEVLAAYPEGAESLAIPTWFYGHEPSNLFATYIAKYFSNSIREDTLLAISLHGIVFAAGSAGTTQEIFMDAAQNHYATYHFISPMVFLGRRRYEVDTLIYPLLRQLAHGRPYYDRLYLTDEPEAVREFLAANPPVAAG